MYCPKCNSLIDDDSMFCGFCGTTIVREPEPLPEKPKPAEQEFTEPEPADPVPGPMYYEPGYYEERRSERVADENAQDYRYREGDLKNLEPADPDSQFCVKCAVKMPKGSRFCPECDARQPIYVRKKLNERIREYFGIDRENGQAKRNKKILKCYGLAMLVFLLIPALCFIIPSFINLNNYAKVKFDGYDTVGRARVAFDESKIRYKLETSMYPYDVDGLLRECVDYDLSPTRKLSNGDVVSLKWDCDDGSAGREHHVILMHTDKDKKASGYMQAGEFDPFANVKIVYDGMSPNGYVIEIEPQKDGAAQDLYYELDRYNELKNGDHLTMTVKAPSYDDMDLDEYCAYNWGVLPTRTSVDITVNDLEEYAKTAADIGDPCLSQMKNKAEDVFKQELMNYGGSADSLKGMEYLGNYFLKAKSDSSWPANRIYLVYKVKVFDSFYSADKEYEKTDEFYWCISFFDLTKKPSGENIVNLDDYSVPYNTVHFDSGDGWAGGNWNYPGYATVIELYNAEVATPGLELDIENNVKAQ